MVEPSDLSKLHLEFEGISETGDGRLDIVCVISVERTLKEDVLVSVGSSVSSLADATLRAGEYSVTTNCTVSTDTDRVWAFYGDYPRNLRSDRVSIASWLEDRRQSVDEGSGTAPPLQSSPEREPDYSDSSVERESTPVAEQDAAQVRESQQATKSLYDTLHTISERITRVEEMQQAFSVACSHQSPQPQQLLVKVTEVQSGEYVLVATIHPQEAGKPVLCTVVHKNGHRDKMQEHTTDQFGRTEPIAVSVSEQERHVHVVLEATDVPACTIRLFNLQETSESY